MHSQQMMQGGCGTTPVLRISIKEMEDAALAMGANAVVGVDIDYEVVREGMLMVTSSGTAVNVE